jgi:hypothetical protein
MEFTIRTVKQAVLAFREKPELWMGNQLVKVMNQQSGISRIEG